MKTRNPVVADVADAFGRLRQRGHFLAAWDGGCFERDRYTGRIENEGGLNNHFQGVVRLGRHVVIAGGDPRKPKTSHLFVIRMGSRLRDRPLRSNLVARTVPPAGDRVVRALKIDSTYWHAGGIGASGDLLAVPIETGARSRVVFYDFTRPEHPVRLEPVLDRPKRGGAAAALAAFDDGRLLLAVWTNRPRGSLELYLSSGPGANSFGPPVSATLPKEFLEAEYQGIHLVTQRDGSLFLLGSQNTSNAAPLIPGSDMLDLWALPFGSSAPAAEAKALAQLAPRRVASRKFLCKDRQANMDAGAGVWVDAAGELHAYSCYHWRQDDLVRFLEFRAQAAVGAPTITERRDAWIDLFEDKGFKGHCLALAGDGKAATELADYRRLSVEGSDFNDKVSSIRFQIPAGATYRLFEERDHAGAQHDLVGTGQVVEIADFLPGDRISSSRWTA